jgi:hypothetical protein
MPDSVERSCSDDDSIVSNDDGNNSSNILYERDCYIEAGDEEVHIIHITHTTINVLFFATVTTATPTPSVSSVIRLLNNICMCSKSLCTCAINVACDLNIYDMTGFPD